MVNRFGHWFGTGLVVPVPAIFQIDRGLSLTQVGINGLVYAATVAVLEIPTGGLSDTLGRRKVYLISLLVSIACAGVFVVARSPLALAAGFMLMGMARALSSGCMDAYFVDAFDALEESGELQRFLARIGVFVPLSPALGGLGTGRASALLMLLTGLALLAYAPLVHLQGRRFRMPPFLVGD